ncbi:hypothetical protein DL766_002874 [Monosporascus sp. MC13-8B]|nr:hypothetical protein DL766_002874 [Monosporascus sp. MC13-8B]
MHMAPFMQFATLPIANGPFAEVVESTVPGCLQFALYNTTNNATGQVDIIIVEHYVNAAAHDNFTASDVYQQMLQDTAEQRVLRGEPVLTVVTMAGGFTDRSPKDPTKGLYKRIYHYYSHPYARGLGLEYLATHLGVYMYMGVPEAQITKLRQVVSLITQAAETAIAEWENGTAAAESLEGVELPSRPFFKAQRTLLAAAGSIEELVSNPATRLLSLSMQYFESRALHVAAEHRVPDILRAYPDGGLHVSLIAEQTGIEEQKLSRILRCLCSQHVFRQTATDTFANNAVSQALVGNEDLRAYIMLFALDIYSASDYLPVALTDAKFGSSYKVEETAFNLAVGTELPRWSWLEARVPASQVKRVNSRGYPRTVHDEVHRDETNGVSPEPVNLVQRPELEIFSRAMVGGGKVFGAAHVVDYPWGELGKATLVDVGGGIGGFPLQLSELYPNLNFVVQDRPANIEKGKAFWSERNPKALSSGRVRLMSYDFFQKNPIKDAEVYWLRAILHDWSDDYCVQILSQTHQSMGANSRILIADHVMNTTLGCEELKSAPEPLLANYGPYVRYSHQRDLAMMSIINGIERTPEQLKKLLSAAGLKIRKIWECRSQVGIVEAVKA